VKKVVRSVAATLALMSGGEVLTQSVFRPEIASASASPTRTSRFYGKPGTTALLSVVEDSPKTAGYGQIVEAGVAEDSCSTLNVGPNSTIANAAVAKFGPDGSLELFTSAAEGGAGIVDLVGEFAPGVLESTNCQRILDKDVLAGSVTEITGRPNSFAMVNFTLAQGGKKSVGGYLQILSSPNEKPGATSSSNILPSKDIARLTLINFDKDGKAYIYVNADVRLIADLNAYMNDFVDGGIINQRVGDTRNARKPSAQSITTIHVGEPNTTYSVMVTSTGPEQLGFLQVLSPGESVGSTSDLNVSGIGVDNGVYTIVPTDENGDIRVFTSTSTHILVDLIAKIKPGKFTPSGSRLLDTRSVATPQPPKNDIKIMIGNHACKAIPDFTPQEIIFSGLPPESLILVSNFIDPTQSRPSGLGSIGTKVADKNGEAVVDLKAWNTQPIRSYTADINVYKPFSDQLILSKSGIKLVFSCVAPEGFYPPDKLATT
jgi:hypothetical protein